MFQAFVVAFGVAANGWREVLGFDVGDSENESFWTAFLGSLKAPGLTGGLQLVISDARPGLKTAIGTVFQGAAWQRCRVHYADLRIMPMWSRDPLRGRGLALARSA